MVIYICIPSHASHGDKEGPEKASLIPFETDINALQESVALPLEEAWLHLIQIIQTNGKQLLGRFVLALLRKQVITNDKLLLSLVLNVEEWLFYSHKQTQLAFGNLYHHCLI